VASASDPGGEASCEGDHRADAEIDFAGDDDHCHAEGDDAFHRNVVEDVQ
jgi:hypothetical protein